MANPIIQETRFRTERENREKKIAATKEKPVIGFFADKLETARAMNAADGTTGICDSIKAAFNTVTFGLVGYIKDYKIDKEIDLSKIDKSMTESQKLEVLQKQYADSKAARRDLGEDIVSDTKSETTNEASL